MAAPITVPIERHTDYLPTETAQVEVAGVVLADRVVVNNDRNLYGDGSPDATEYGHIAGQSYGDGFYGLGLYGFGAAILDHRTLSSYVVEDYAVRLRSVDEVGNVGAWGTATTIQHRPQPPTPTSQAVSGGVLSWSWSDP